MGRTRSGTAAIVATVAATAIALAAAAPASATVTCDYNAPADVLTASANAEHTVFLQVSGSGEIEVIDATNEVQPSCDTGGGDPTVNNTSNINLTDTGVSTRWLVTNPEDLAPGTAGTGEVEVLAALGGGTDLFAAFDFDSDNDFWVLGAIGLNWNGDSDVDASFLSVEEVALGGENGNDAITARGQDGTGAPFAGPATLTANGGDGNDVIEGGDSGDLLGAGDGVDTLRGFGGADVLTSDTGTNELQGGDGDDRVNFFSNVGVRVDLGVAGPQDTGIGTDTLTSVEGVEGTNQPDVLIGNGEANALVGQDGDDTLDGRGGSDSLNGGAGVNTATYESAPAGVNVSLDAGTATGAAGDDTLTGIADLIGSPFADTLTGDAVNNSITGLGGTDTVRAEGGEDTVRVRDGGPDTADCGDGADTATADAVGIDTLTACEDVLSSPTGGGDTGVPEPSNDFSFGKAKKNKRKGTAKLTVNVPGAGDLELAKSKKVKGAEKRAPSKGSVKLKVKPKGKAKDKLADTGKAKANAEVTYTPDGGAPNTQSEKIKLVKRR